MPSPDPISILFVTANPDGTESLATDVEARRIDEALWNSLNRERFAVHQLGAARIGDLAVYLRRHGPRILHIALHGTADGLLFNDPEDWQEQTLAGEDLAGIVAAYQAEAAEKLQLVVLAGCGTESAARLLCAHTGCAIGTSDDISDRAVLHFSPAFYAALGDERTVGNAFDNAVAEVQAHGQQSAAALLRLLTRPGIDPHSLRLDTPTHLPLSDAHLAYLRRWFGKGWATVNLADISQRQERASLLDVYVPLHVDFELDIQFADQRIVDWWVHRETPETRRGGLQPLATPDENVARPHEIIAAKERVWANLGVGEADLQKIVNHIQAKIDEGKDSWEYHSKIHERKDLSFPWDEPLDETHTWPLEAEHAASLQSRFVLLGEPGGGKSSFLRHLALCLAGELRRRAGDPDVPTNASLDALRDWLLDAFTPVYIELRALVASHFPALTDNTRLPDADDFWKYVREDLDGSGLAGFEAELRILCGNGEAILLLDGLDEIPQAGDERRQAQVKAFVASLIRAYPQLRVIVTSRPHAYSRGEWALDGFGRAELEPLLPSRLYELAQALFRIVAGNDSEAESFILAIENDPHIEPGLHCNPLFFTLLAVLWLHPDTPRQLPASRADLYRQAVNLLLGRWTQHRAADPSLAESLGIMTPEHLRSVLESLACTVNEQCNPQQDATFFGVETLLGILFRAGFQTGLHDVPDYLTEYAGILISPALGEFAFVHRSFQEHLAAGELTHPHADERIPPVPAERRFPQGLARRVQSRPDLWENVARLAADELFTQKRENDLWRLLVEMTRPYLTSQKSDSLGMPDFSQVAFLALEIVIQHNLFAVERDEFDPLAHSFGLLRRVAEAVLIDYEHFEPEQRLVVGQLLGSRPGLDQRKGVGLRPDGLPDIEWVKIPEVDEEGQREFIYQDEKRPSPPDFWMAKYPITYAQFQTFIDAEDGWRNSQWWEGLSEQRTELRNQRFAVWNHPRENVSWFQAVEFCRWLTEQTRKHPEMLPPEMRSKDNWRISLPTEWQWEKAARGCDGCKYPWGGDTYQPGYANINETYENAGPHYLQSTSAVGMYPQGATPDGLLDLSGNVWEWCLNEHANPEHIRETGSVDRVIRGGSWRLPHYFAAAAFRDNSFPDDRGDSLGFRVVVSASVPV